jgi:DNA polymerase III epsilon subunit-like protein
VPKKFQKSSKLDNHYVLFDLETGGTNPYTTEPLEIAALVIDCNTLEPKENGVFQTLVQPTDWSLVDDKALQVNHLTKEEILEKGVSQETMFNEFVKFLRQFQRSDKYYHRLYPVGHNIINFDIPIMNRLAIKYSHIENDQPALFSSIHRFDIIDIVRLWYHNNDELPSYRMDDLRPYFGLSSNNAHRALKDVEDSLAIFKRFLQFHRKLSAKYTVQFKGCFNEI